ncbi:phosphate ABC transporter substrate-binding protein [Aquabacterium sp.]|uniref:phosphate ABC transporter substrate-binding protein n=1 Tax=Aquabacterium sp. TaxID=1872578 RepID=UPI0035AF199A
MKLNYLKAWCVAAALGAIHAMACADIVVVVGAQSPITSLTKDQVADIYLGNSRVYPDGSTAIPTIIGPGPYKAEFFMKVLGRSESQVRAIWARQTFTGRGATPRELNDAVEVKQVLVVNPRAIGFIDRSALDSSVKVVLTP